MGCRPCRDRPHHIIREQGIDCSFEWLSAYQHAPGGEATRAQAESLEADARLANELGFDADFVGDVPLVGGPGIRFENQARFHPRRYLASLARVLRDRGVAIFEHSEAGEFRVEPLAIQSNGHWVRGNVLVIATHNPLVGVAGTAAAAAFQTKLALFTSYVVTGKVPRGSVPDALFWDTNAAYRYLRIDPHSDFDLVILGGEDHKTGQESDTESCFARLELALVNMVPEVQLAYRWSGQVIETPDGLPYIGLMTDHQYAATGFGGNGLTFGTLAAMMIADAICRRSNPWAGLFDPGRKALRHGLWHYIKENADYPYDMMRSRFASAEGKSLRSVRRGEGAVIDVAGQKVAASRSSNGTLTLRSAVCTHMGCLVGWNQAEHTWDCPCHGSRFTDRGQVISGPAGSPLADVKITK